MAASITIAPIVSGMEEQWRTFVSDLQGPRRVEWVESQRRRGITREMISLAGVEPVFSVIYTESRDPSAAADDLVRSTDGFDVWYRQRLGELLGEPLRSEIVFDSAPRRGPWRGWRR